MRYLAIVNRVTEFFFLLIGAGYLLCFLFWKNNFYPFEAEIFLRLADLPLALFGIFYALTSLRLSLAQESMGDNPKGNSFRLTDGLILLAGLILFATLVYIDLKMPNRFPFPKL